VDVSEAREQWANDQGEMDSASLVFLDETGINVGMTRLYGRAFGEERVIDYVPDVRFDRVSLLSSIRLDGTLVPLTYSGTLDGKLFLAYVTQRLAPTLKKGDLVIMDNASPHKVKGVVDAIEAKGAFVIYQPTYSPDFNPAENMWSKIKSALRTAKARTVDALFDALKEALDAVPISDIIGWFRVDGYYVQ
jgi:transposase